jgi:hypothetical protein
VSRRKGACSDRVLGRPPVALTRQQMRDEIHLYDSKKNGLSRDSNFLRVSTVV